MVSVRFVAVVALSFVVDYFLLSGTETRRSEMKAHMKQEHPKQPKKAKKATKDEEEVEDAGDGPQSQSDNINWIGRAQETVQSLHAIGTDVHMLWRIDAKNYGGGHLPNFKAQYYYRRSIDEDWLLIGQSSSDGLRKKKFAEKEAAQEAYQYLLQLRRDGKKETKKVNKPFKAPSRVVKGEAIDTTERARNKRVEESYYGALSQKQLQQLQQSQESSLTLYYDPLSSVYNPYHQQPHHQQQQQPPPPPPPSSTLYDPLSAVYNPYDQQQQKQQQQQQQPPPPPPPSSSSTLYNPLAAVYNPYTQQSNNPPFQPPPPPPQQQQQQQHQQQQRHPYQQPSVAYPQLLPSKLSFQPPPIYQPPSFLP
jgi:hypothetical protein